MKLPVTCEVVIFCTMIFHRESAFLFVGAMHMYARDGTISLKKHSRAKTSEYLRNYILQ